MLRKAKIRAWSDVLGRAFHADLHSAGDAPAFLMLFVGGSGKNRDEYERRGERLIEVFDAACERAQVERPTVGAFALLYVTAPYDVDFDAVAEGSATAWQKHAQEILAAANAELSEVLPVYRAAFSGGAALAMAAVNDRSIGAGFLGADAVSDAWTLPPSFAAPIACLYNVGDAVFEANALALRNLADAGVVELHRRLPGGHEVRDYVANGSFGGLLRRAARLLAEAG